MRDRERWMKEGKVKRELRIGNRGKGEALGDKEGYKYGNEERN